MAFTPVVPATLNVSIRKGAAQQFKSNAVLDFASAAVNLSAWTALTAKAVAGTPNPTTADVTFGTVTADANGIVTLEVSDTDLSTANLGVANLVITGKPTAGDIAQLLASGSLSLNGG